MNLIKKEWNGFEIEFEELNGQLMANATMMCEPFPKKAMYDWLRTKKTQSYIKALELKTGITVLSDTKVGKNGSTWIHEKLILRLAQWLNDDFAIQCDEWVAELLRTGTVTTKPKTQIDILVENALALQAQERKLAQLETEVEVVREDVKQLAHTIVNQVHQLNYFTLSGYYAQHSKAMPHNNVLKSLGKAAVQVSNAQSVPVSTTPHEKYGSVKVYRDDILKSILGF